MARIKAPQGTQAVVRALRLLRVFTPVEPKLTLSELSSRMGLTKTTAHRLLMALESEGLVARDLESSTYYLGPEVIALGSQALLTSDLRVRVRPTLERIAARTAESTSFDVLVGDHMLNLDGVKGRHLISAMLEVGSRWPAHATSTGKAVLAHLPDASCEYLLGLPMSRYTKHTLTDPAELRAELAKIRETGYAVASQELEADYVAVAAEFRGPMGELQGALCVGGPANRFNLETISSIGTLLRSEADTLSLNLCAV